MRLVFSGGGTGGHIFPAVAVARHIKNKYPDAQILFIGARGKMEEKRVPKEGFDIETLWISGFQRKLTFQNLLFPLKLVVSMVQAFRLLRSFRPDAVAGFGGYASGAALYVAGLLKIPCLIQEQNSYPGITNKLLAGKVGRICTAYPGMEGFFAADRTILTGNPVRQELFHREANKEAAKKMLNLDTNRMTVLIAGGSLGARSLNRAMRASFEEIAGMNDLQFIWQCGSLYYEEYKGCETARLSHVRIFGFIEEMMSAYDAADIVVCRAGALTLSELMVMGKASVLVPSPNVAEDHQTRNARALVDREAALMLRDDELEPLFLETIKKLAGDENRIRQLEMNILKMAKPDATERIANELIALAKGAKP